MANHKHIILDDRCKSDINFSPISQNRNKSTLPQITDFIRHADRLSAEYDDALSTIDAYKGSKSGKCGVEADGYYLDIDLANADISETVLNSKKHGVHLMTFAQDKSKETEEVTATVYVAKPKKKWLHTKLEDYRTKTTKNGRRQEALINRIEKIHQSTIWSFIADEKDRDDYGRMTPTQHGYFEIWMSNDEELYAKNLSKFGILGITQVGKRLQFTDSIIVLVKTTPQALEDIPYTLDAIQEVRIYHQPSVLTEGSECEQREWCELIKEYTRNNTNAGSAKVAILDTGVNNGHPLLEAFIEEQDCVAVIATDTADHEGHGTQMTGLTLYGDMSPIINGSGVEVSHKAMSIKMMPGNGEKANAEDAYGPITEDALIEARKRGAKVCCMALTQEGYCLGEATSWSAAIDQALYRDGESDAILFVSAGNVKKDVPQGEDYHEICKTYPIESPAQAVNAITVGAYTEKVFALNNPRGAQTLAERGDLSPHSRTSYPWSQARIKPEIVMEGGNVASNPLLGNLNLPDLSLVTTDNNFQKTPFASVYATSAATALAAKLAAEVQTANPTLSALSIRALMIHSARWTTKMQEYVIGERLRMFGYGVPNPMKAIASQETNATFVYEGELHPYEKDERGKCRCHMMHQFKLPWPKQLLVDMADIPVTMRVTLSYYIQPSPGHKSYKSLYKYQSVGLAFDVKLPEETTESLIARHNKKQEVDFKFKNRPERWTIGIENRKSSAVQCDWIEGITAAQLAECGEIVVFPTTGWWSKRKFDEISNKIRYSLVVSIETQEQDVYTPIAQTVMVGV